MSRGPNMPQNSENEKKKTFFMHVIDYAKSDNRLHMQKLAFLH